MQGNVSIPVSHVCHQHFVAAAAEANGSSYTLHAHILVATKVHGSQCAGSSGVETLQVDGLVIAYVIWLSAVI